MKWVTLLHINKSRIALVVRYSIQCLIHFPIWIKYFRFSFIWKTKQIIHFNNYQLLTVKYYFIMDDRAGETSSHSTNTLQVVLVTTFSVILSKEFGNFTISSLGMSVHYPNSISKLSIITIRG